MIKELRLPGTEEGELMSGRDFVSYLRERLSTEGHLPEYLDIECNNLNFSIEHELEAKRRLLDPSYTLDEVLKFYGIPISPTPRLEDL